MDVQFTHLTPHSLPSVTSQDLVTEVTGRNLLIRILLKDVGRLQNGRIASILLGGRIVSPVHFAIAATRSSRLQALERLQPLVFDATRTGRRQFAISQIVVTFIFQGGSQKINLALNRCIQNNIQ